MQNDDSINGDKTRLLTSAEAADLLGLKNPHTLAVWRSMGRYPELRYVKFGRSVRYREQDLKRFIVQHLQAQPEATV